MVPGKAATLLLFPTGLEPEDSPLLPDPGEGVTVGLLGMAPMMEATMAATLSSDGLVDDESSGRAALFSGGVESPEPADIGTTAFGVPAAPLFAGV